MSKIKEIYVEIKRNKNYQTYTVGQTIEIEEGDDVPMVTQIAQAVCRKRAEEQLELDKPSPA